MKDLSRRLPKPGAWFAPLLDLKSSDAGLALALFVVGVVSRIPFRSQLLYHWDSVNFALGMEQFDVRLHQPHPPGYLLYVLLGRLVNSLVGDANASLVWISVVFSGLTVSAVYLLGRRLFGRTEGIIAASLALTGPAFWFYGDVALTYAVEAFFVTALALVCLETLRGDQWMAFLSALLLGLAGGIRQTTLVLMFPLWLFSLRRCRWWVSVLAILLLGLTAMAWLAPTIALSGGLDAYLDASRSIGGGVLENFELFGGEQSLISLMGPIARLGAYLAYSLMLGLIPLLWGLLKGLGNARTWLKRWLPDDRAHIVALWLIPNLAFYAPLVRAPGHLFSFVTALVLLAAAALAMLSRDLSNRLSWPAARSLPALTALTLIVNVAFFLFAPPYLFDVQRVVTTTPSWPTIHYRDRYLAERIDHVVQHFDAADTLLLTAGPDYRHPDYYLRDYATLNCEMDESFVRDVPANSRVLVFFSEGLADYKDDVQTSTLPGGGEFYYLWLDADSEIVVDALQVSVQPLDQ